MYRLSQSECFVLADDYTPPPGDMLHINSDKNFWKEMKMRPLQFNCESIQTAPFPAGLFLRQDF